MKYSDWLWFGHAAHLIVGNSCRFHLATKAGHYLISTVGEYFPDEPIREILAKSRGVELVGRGDARRADYMEKIGFETIGCDRKYETMVFLAGAVCVAEGCACGLPEISGVELDSEGYNDAASATSGHLAMCQKWAVEPLVAAEEAKEGKGA